MSKGKLPRGLYVLPGTDIYGYKFHYKGTRHQASTGSNVLRDATRILREARERAIREWEEAPPEPTEDEVKQNITVLEAVDNYMATQRKTRDDAITLDLEEQWLLELVEKLKPDTRMRDLDTERVAACIQAFVGRPKKNGNGNIKGGYLNRYGSSLLKRVYHMCRRSGVPVKHIQWSDARITQKEGGPRTREIKIHEEHKFRAAKDAYGQDRFRDGYGDCYDFALMVGVRAMNLFPTWEEVDWATGEIKFAQKGKVVHTVKMTTKVRDLLKRQVGNHSVYVFTYVARRTRLNPKTRQQEVRGQRYPVTQSGFTSWYKRTAKQLGLNVTVHDIRRTAGGRMLRATGNLKAAQKLLGHKDIVITAKHYAHVQDDEMVGLMERVETYIARQKAQLKDEGLLADVECAT
jgi:integrase